LFQNQRVQIYMKKFVYLLNSRWHYVGMQIFMIVVALHFSEHLVQIWQLWVLGWPRPQCMGLLGLAYPWLMRSEWFFLSTGQKM